MGVVWQLQLFFMKRKPGCHAKTIRETSHAYDIVAITTKGKGGMGGKRKEKENRTSIFFCSKSPQ